ncbi:chloramphenicol acetyltransferase, partial [Flavonifractor plautii]|nr:chloramphenicol acetyltransferase [Flavonifractor plautii]
LVYFTCLPWFPLTALKNEKDVNPSDSVPRAAWGRWEEEGSRTRLLLSLELNHRLLDGVHVGRFYEALNRWMEGL